MDDLFKNDDFAQYIANELCPAQDLSNIEKWEEICKSPEKFFLALESFTIKAGGVLVN
jgi:hypothetical protein